MSKSRKHPPDTNTEFDNFKHLTASLLGLNKDDVKKVVANDEKPNQPKRLVKTTKNVVKP